MRTFAMRTFAMRTFAMRRVVLVTGTVAVLASSAATVSAAPEQHPALHQRGVVVSGDDHPIADARVSILQAGERPGVARTLGTARTDAHGLFDVGYATPKRDAILYVLADGGLTGSNPVRLATMLGAEGEAPPVVTVNERTTVATAYSMARFTESGQIGGGRPGLPNAASIWRNLAEPGSGDIGAVLATSPNGAETSTLPTVNSLANMVSACVRDGTSCAQLFELATAPDGSTPTDTLAAMVAIARDPGRNVADLLELAQRQPTYAPALPADAATNPDEVDYVNSFVLAVRYTGAGPDGPVLDGPGNIAFDSDGHAWVNNNYVYDPRPFHITCGSTALVELLPNGQSAPGSPFGGDDASQNGVHAGGLYGAGFGIAVGPDDDVWVTNFGFQGQPLLDDSQNPPCPNDAAKLAVSVSQFDEHGTALSPDGDPSRNIPGGYRVRSRHVRLQQPQGVQADQLGDVWAAGCIDGTVVRFDRGDPAGAMIKEVERSPLVDEFDKAFDVAIDRRGHAWITGNGTSNVVEIDRRFRVVRNLADGFDFPMGIASDSAGNLWVADAGLPNPPCPPALAEDPSPTIGDDGAENVRAAVSLIDRSTGRPVVGVFGKDDADHPRDGLRWPWGIAVDGADNVWIANFAGQRLMQLCGASRATCPAGTETGDPVSPDAGYYFNGLERVTAVQIDPSGNVWATNNWILDAFERPQNPGGREVVAFIGLGAPVRTPLLGPPRRP